MPSFSRTSKERLATCHTDLQILFNEVIKYYDCTVVCGYRGQIDQDNAYALGKSQVKFPNSKHNTPISKAVDVAPYEPGGIDWTREQGYYFAGFVLGVHAMLKKDGEIKSEIRLGADWDSDNDIQDQTFKDVPHFEIVT